LKYLLQGLYGVNASGYDNLGLL